MPSNHLILCCPLLLPSSIFSSMRVFSNESVLHIRWPKYWKFSFNMSPSNEPSGLISFRMDWLDNPCSPSNTQKSSPTLQFKSINSLVFSFLYSPSLTSVHDYWKNHSMGIQKNIYFCFIDYTKALDCWTTTDWKILKQMRIPDHRFFSHLFLFVGG